MRRERRGSDRVHYKEERAVHVAAVDMAASTGRSGVAGKVFSVRIIQRKSFKIILIYQVDM